MTDKLAKLYRRPGFLVRRAHQIAVSLFLEETRQRVTTTQYGILYVLRHHPGIDQVSLAKLLGLDRSTTGMVLKKLEAEGLVGRGVGRKDRRRRSLHLTKSGRATLARLSGPARRSQERMLSALAANERETFLRLLGKVTRKFNDSVRAPLLTRDQPTAMSSRAKPATRL
jgi:DNA-binding MarR family transcriptional regulator